MQQPGGEIVEDSRWERRRGEREERGGEGGWEGGREGWASSRPAG